MWQIERSKAPGSPAGTITKAIPFYENNIVLLTFFIATLYKMLLMFAYRSTDFEVHRNWLAITFSRPLHMWYGDASASEWTLDYPPFFAYFEWALSQFAYYFFDPRIVDVANLGYGADSVVYFQRATVIVTDLMLLYGVHFFSKTYPRYRMVETAGTFSKMCIVVSFVCLNPGLLLLDSVHFQYNGFLLGISFVSLTYIKMEKDLSGAFFFAVLLCFKHLWLYSAPVYGVYLFRHHCFDLQNGCTSNRRKMLMENVRETLKSGSKHVGLDKYEWGQSDDDDDDDEEEEDQTAEAMRKGRRRHDDDTDDADDEDSGSDVDIDEEFFASTRKERSPSLELRPKKLGQFNFTAFLELALVVLGVFAVAFAPLLYHAYLHPVEGTSTGEASVLAYTKQIFSRLFPFGRGLTHAYWAPNIWALYNFLDKGKYIFFSLPTLATGASTTNLARKQSLSLS